MTVSAIAVSRRCPSRPRRSVSVCVRQQCKNGAGNRISDSGAAGDVQLVSKRRQMAHTSDGAPHPEADFRKCVFTSFVKINVIEVNTLSTRTARVENVALPVDDQTLAHCWLPVLHGCICTIELSAHQSMIVFETFTEVRTAFRSVPALLAASVKYGALISCLAF